jgi:peptidoglycan hydrolase-like protein with peptidoglycan-binding domain
MYAEVQQLEARLQEQQKNDASSATAGTHNSATPGTFTGTFARNLNLGSTGPDVLALQQFLNLHDAAIASVGPGSSGNETDYFGPMTQTALASWQSANGISPATGYFGSITRAAINPLMSSNNSPSSLNTAPTAPAAGPDNSANSSAGSAGNSQTNTGTSNPGAGSAAPSY